MEEIETLQSIIDDQNVSILNEDSTSFVIRISEEIEDDDVIKIRFRLVKQWSNMIWMALHAMQNVKIK